jgi:hypothetical protein
MFPILEYVLLDCSENPYTKLYCVIPELVVIATINIHHHEDDEY